MAHSRSSQVWIKVITSDILCYYVRDSEDSQNKSVPCVFHHAPELPSGGRKINMAVQFVDSVRKSHIIGSVVSTYTKLRSVNECNSHCLYSCSQVIIRYYDSQKTKYPVEARPILVQANGEPTRRGLCSVVVNSTSYLIKFQYKLQVKTFKI